MKWIDTTLPTPEENLAYDEALLNLLEEGRTGEVLRFWEASQHFVVLGSSNRVEQEVHLDACREDGVPIVRRHSGGGCVLQGPGCLNFSLVLKIDPGGPTCNITETTRYVLHRHAAVVSALVAEQVEISGLSDLSIGGVKFSGNAQRRRLKALLYHGTFLLEFDIGLMERYLKLPPVQPAYRRQRTHVEFVRNIAVGRTELKRSLAKVWQTDGEADVLPHPEIERLVQEKYSRSDWTFRF